MTHRLLATLTLACAVLAGPAALRAQDSGVTRVDTLRPRGPQSITIDRASVITFGDALPDSAVAVLKEVAGRSGFDFRAVTGPGLIITDTRTNRVYYIPADVPSGCVLLVPGRPQDLVRGQITPDSLDRRIRMYLATVRPFSP
jgi:hypothetical protein